MVGIPPSIAPWDCTFKWLAISSEKVKVTVIAKSKAFLCNYCSVRNVGSISSAIDCKGNRDKIRVEYIGNRNGTFNNKKISYMTAYSI